MKNIFKLCAVMGGLLFVTACDKADEVPPRSETFIREYVLPEPVFLTPEEREEVRKQREEYNKL